MYKNILIPVLLGAEQDPKDAYRAARSLGDEGAQYTVLHVLEIIPAYVTSQMEPGALEQTHKEAKATLKAMAADLPGAKAKMISGHSGRAILDFIDDHDIDCVIVASHKPGLQDYFLGSTAAHVVRHAPCAVHVTR